MPVWIHQNTKRLAPENPKTSGLSFDLACCSNSVKDRVEDKLRDVPKVDYHHDMIAFAIVT